MIDKYFYLLTLKLTCVKSMLLLICCIICLTEFAVHKFNVALPYACNV